jgi:hypothetical protein
MMKENILREGGGERHASRYDRGGQRGHGLLISTLGQSRI